MEYTGEKEERYDTWRTKWSARVHTHNLLLYGIPSLLMVALIVLDKTV
ncbi:hypothetical protein [Bacillus massiliglaciei]|nr:hypothetical protein [Bacillus massiliglaciei]